MGTIIVNQAAEALIWVKTLMGYSKTKYQQ